MIRTVTYPASPIIFLSAPSSTSFFSASSLVFLPVQWNQREIIEKEWNKP